MRFEEFQDNFDKYCQRLGETRESILGLRGPRNAQLARSALMAFCWRNTSASSPQVGQFFGRDHSSVQHAAKVRRQDLFDVLVHQQKQDVLRAKRQKFVSDWKQKRNFVRAACPHVKTYSKPQHVKLPRIRDNYEYTHLKKKERAALMRSQGVPDVTIARLLSY